MAFIIVLEGLDGCGKTTIAKQLNTLLTENNYDCMVKKIDDEPFANLFKELKPTSSSLTKYLLRLDQ